jgi:hypothetical protein
METLGDLSSLTLEDLRKNPCLDEVETEELQLEISVAKPSKQMFFRSHQSEEYRVDIPLLKLESEMQWYFVNPKLWSKLREEMSQVKLMTCIDMFNRPFMWPIKMPVSDRTNKWTNSALLAASESVKSWVRLIPDMPQQRYRVHKAINMSNEPSWPEDSFMDLVKQAFADFQINEIDHPVIKQLRGQQ